HEIFEVLRRTKSAGRREKPEHLVSPRSGERMLHHREQLDVRKTHLLYVRHEPVGQLAISEEPIALLWHTRPRAKVRLVNRERVIEPAPPRLPGCYPVGVAPLIAGDVAHDRRRMRRHLECEAEGVGLLQDPAGLRADLELVLLTLAKI